MEVGRLTGNPGDEARDRRMRAQRLRFMVTSRQFGIGQGRVDRAMADRMQRHYGATAPALGHRMMPFHPMPERSFAKPAPLHHPSVAADPRDGKRTPFATTP